MIIRKSTKWTTEQSFIDQVRASKLELETWRKSEGQAAPMVDSEVAAAIQGEKWTWNPLTEEEEHRRDADQMQLDYEAEKLAAQTTPSLKYAKFRGAEYPNLLDFIDAQAKKSSLDLAIQAQGTAQEQAYFTACLAVKAKYPKPQA